MTVAATTTRSTGSAAGWLIPIGLLLLAFIPVVAGAFRMTTLISGAEVTPDNVRFVTSPIPVVIHIISVTIYAVLGAFQFSPGVRRRWPNWHRQRWLRAQSRVDPGSAVEIRPRDSR